MLSLGFRKTILFFYLFIITGLSLWPSSQMPQIHLFPHSDKVIHMAMYAGVTFLLFWTWPLRFKGINQLLPFFIVLVWGIAMEILQKLTHLGRSFDLTDELANLAGFLPGWICWRIYNKNQVRKSKA